MSNTTKKYLSDMSLEEALHAFEKEFVIQPTSKFYFSIDLKYWAILPCVNFNFHLLKFEIEIEWLCFGFYLRFGKL